MPQDAPDLFVLKIDIAMQEGTEEDAMFARRDARRRALTGQTARPIPLHHWLDDPDWQPD